MAVRFKPKFWYQKDDPYYSEMVNEIKHASSKGYSAIEISRTLGQSPKNIYALMRDAGVIPKLQRKRQKVYSIPQRLEGILSRCHISYLQWCSSHCLDPDETSQALLTDENPHDPASVAAHNALRQDFPKAYSKIMATDPDYSSSFQPMVDSLKTDYTIIIRLNPETNGYTAIIHELEECKVEAPTRIEAFYKLQSRYVAFSAINKLRLLPDRQ